MADFQFSYNSFEAEQIQIIAGSADPIEKAQKLADDLQITYPVSYGLDFKEISRITGGFYESDRNFLHPINLLLRPDRTIAVVSYSSGPLGRFTAQEVLRIVRFWKSQEKR